MNKQRTIRKILLGILASAFLLAFLFGCSFKKDFSYWANDSESLKELTDYIKAVTNKNNDNYIPKEDRIAVFDLDGTLMGELSPTYLEWEIYAYRVLDDPDYKDQATEQMIETAELIRKIPTDGTPEWLEAAHIRDNAKAFENMSEDDFKQYVLDFLQKDAVGFENIKYADLFYKPMIEVIDYLKKNDFTVFIVSGTGTSLCRIVLESVVDLQPYQIIGSVYGVELSGQGNLDGLDYVMSQNDDIVRDGTFALKNVKANKIKTIWEHIGKQPVLSFGNSTGDFSMAMMTTSNNPYLSKAFFILADDEIREYGDTQKAKQMKEKIEDNGWNTFSMKNDWITIYGENVNKTSRILP